MYSSKRVSTNQARGRTAHRGTTARGCSQWFRKWKLGKNCDGLPVGGSSRRSTYGEATPPFHRRECGECIYRRKIHNRNTAIWEPIVFSSCVNVQRERQRERKITTRESYTEIKTNRETGEGGEMEQSGSEQSFHWNPGDVCNELERGMFA